MPNVIRNRFVMKLPDVLPHWHPKLPLLLIRNASEKERSRKAYDIIRSVLHDSIELCTVGILQNAEDTISQMPEYAFSGARLTGSPSSAPRQICELVLERIESVCVETVVLDITHLPTHVSLALCQRLAWSSNRPTSLSEVVAVYTKPILYEATLGGGFTQPRIVDGFGGGKLVRTREKDIGWIPILGFSERPVLEALEIVLEQAQEADPNIKEKDLLNGRTYPIIGWPPYRPDFFNRALAENRRLLHKVSSPERHLRYGSADDPFEVAQLIAELVEERGDIQFICSAQGSQPMNLGCAMACSEAGLQLLHSFARSQIPNQKVSHATGDTVAYWLFTKD